MSDNEPDELVQSTFVIECASQARKGRTKANDDSFAPLFPYEEDARASSVRRSAFDDAVMTVRTAFESFHRSFYAPTLSELSSVLDGSHPSCVGILASSYPLLKASVLMGVASSGTLVSLVREVVKQRQGWQWVHLRSRECTDLPTSLRLLTARALQSSANAFETSDLTDPASMFKLGKEATVCVFIDSVATFHYGAFNDLLQSIHALSEETDAPAFQVILTAESGSITLDDKLDPASSPLLDIVPLFLPSFTEAFEGLIVELFLQDTQRLAVWPSGPTIDFLRRMYYESWPDLDQLQSALEVALHSHFSRRPLSALASKEAVEVSLWTSDFFNRIRCTLLDQMSMSTDLAHDVYLPVPSVIDRVGTKQEYLKKLLEDDTFLLQSMMSFHSSVKKRRASFCLAVRLSHQARTLIGLNAIKSDDARLYLEPRKSELGGLFTLMQDNVHARHVIQDIRTATRGSSLSTLERLLKQIDSDKLLKLPKDVQELSTLMARVSDITQYSGDEGEGDERSSEARIERVQKHLVREEASTSLKREIADWLSAVLRSLLVPLVPLEEEVWTTLGTSENLLSMIAPAPRVNILTALMDPTAFHLDSIDVPDICRAYQTYREAGRMINIGDWFTAFKQSLSTGGHAKSTSNGNGHVNGKSPVKRQRLDEGGKSSDGESSSELSEEEDEVEEAKRRKRESVREAKELSAWNRSESVQARFALAVHELGRMGFLKRTRRKPEHILKLVYDLPPLLD